MLRVREEDGAVDGRFTDGKPDYDFVDATRVSDYWYNAIQEELCNLVEFTGQKLDEKKEYQLALATRKMTGFDKIINSSYFVGKNDKQKSMMNSAGFFETIEALRDLQEGQKARVESNSTIKINGPVEILKDNVTIQFSSNFILENGDSTHQHAFIAYGDGVQIIDVRTKGFNIPFNVEIKKPIFDEGVFIADRCIALGAERLVKYGNERIIQLNSIAISPK